MGKIGGKARFGIARDLWHTLHMKAAMRLWPERVWRKVSREANRRSR